MKNIFLLICLIFVTQSEILACNWTSSSFCSSSQSSLFLNDLIVYGKIVSIDNDGIDFEIIDILRGEEDKTTIRIWDGVDFDCNGTFSMAASELGKINDQLIIILPKISKKKSSWEIIGDYRRPNFFEVTPNLRVENEIVYGLISGFETFPFVEEQATYENFKNSWNTNNNCSSVVLKNEKYKIQKLKVLSFPNNKFKIVSDNLSKKEFNIYNVFGLRLKSEFQVNNEVEIDLSEYSLGIYFINLVYENNKIKTIKLIRK